MLSMNEIAPPAFKSGSSLLSSANQINSAMISRQNAEGKAASNAMAQQRKLEQINTEYEGRNRVKETEYEGRKNLKTQDAHIKALDNMVTDPLNAKAYAANAGITWTPQMEQLSAEPKRFALTVQAAKMVKQMGITNAKTAQTFASTFVNNGGSLDQTIDAISSMQQYKPSMARSRGRSTKNHDDELASLGLEDTSGLGGLPPETPKETESSWWSNMFGQQKGELAPPPPQLSQQDKDMLMGKQTAGIAPPPTEPTARFLRMNGNEALFQRPDGTVFGYGG
jgi:hypothetical protein